MHASHFDDVDMPYISPRRHIPRLNGWGECKHGGPTMQHCLKTYAPISGMPRGIWHVLMEQAPTPGAQSCIQSPTYSLQVPHISLLQTVCGREIWVFGCNNPDWVPTSRGSKSPSFLQHLPQLCQVGHTMDRCINNHIYLTTCGVQQRQVYGRQKPTKEMFFRRAELLTVMQHTN